jgi:L-seryl-tRNA(Ser) seleniumtransferase
MSTTEQSNRRGFMKMLAASPLLAQIAAQGVYEKSAAAVGLDPKGNVYSRLGVKTVINCRGTWTYLSGSLQFPEVHEAQVEASRHFVNMVELHQAVGRRLAELTGAESGLITSGAAGAMAAATAACMAGSDAKKIWQLPDTTGLKHEVIMVGGRSAFDSAIRLTGAKLVLVEKIDSGIAINPPYAMTHHRSWRRLQRESLSRRTTMCHCFSTMRRAFHDRQHQAVRQNEADLYTFSGKGCADCSAVACCLDAGPD